MGDTMRSTIMNTVEILAPQQILEEKHRKTICF